MLPPSTQLLVDLFEATPHVMIFVKDQHGHYLAVNDMFVRRMQRQRQSDVVGYCADDFFPPDLAIAYRAQDQSLLRTGLPVRNQLEIITDAHGRREWFLTTRLLHHDKGFDPVIVAVSTQAHIAVRGHDPGAGLQAAIDLAGRDRQGRLRVIDLARAAQLTTDQLEHAMRNVLGVSPKQYLMRTRLDRSAMLLATTDLTISDVAAKCGYYDQSQLTKYFKAAMGLTPRQYRATVRNEQPPSP